MLRHEKNREMGKVANGFLITFSVLNLIMTSAIILALYMAYVKAQEAAPKLMPLLKDDLGTAIEGKISGVTTTIKKDLQKALVPLEEKMVTCVRGQGTII